MTTIDVLRVFTDENGDFGNELGIVESTDETRGNEQRIAVALGFSETVFVDGVADGRATIRIFTPADELPFAGHPSVGAAWWFAQTGRGVDVLVERAGDVAVRRDGDTTWIAGRAEWAPEFAFVAYDTPVEVDALDAADYETGMNYAHAWIDEPAGVLRSRMFGPEHDIAEDEATGAAAVAVTTRLGRDLEIHQGAGSLLFTRRGTDGVVEVGGRTVWDRRFELPA